MKSYLRITGALFGLIVALHVMRLVQGSPAQVGSWSVPMWVSWVGIVVAGALCIWAVRLARR